MRQQMRKITANSEREHKDAALEEDAVEQKKLEVEIGPKSRKASLARRERGEGRGDECVGGAAQRERRGKG